ncbi:MAG: hypothetical protein ACO1NY_10915, partial [Pseudorhodoplanes sp.]
MGEYKLEDLTSVIARREAPSNPVFRDGCFALLTMTGRNWLSIRVMAGLDPAIHTRFGIARGLRARQMTPEQIVSRLLYRDGLMLIVDKP